MLVKAALALPLLLAPQVNAAYSLLKSYEGQSFFDDWTFYGHYDNLTNGDAIFVSKSESSSVAYYDSSLEQVIIKVDNTTVVPYNEKRNTVRIESDQTYGVGAMWVFDATHVPYGCSVWGAMWSSTSNWPAGGEIDTFEGVNGQTTNHMAMHTTSGCTADGTSLTQTGNLTYANCDSNANSNSGCSVTDPRTNSYGAPFAAAGGGVWVTELATTGVNIWFFSRADVPSDLLHTNTSAVPDPAGWGLPVASYGSSSCDVDNYFAAQHLVIDITLCGDWAGNAAVFAQTCPGTCYTDYVLNATNYDTAYFALNSVRVYSDGSASATTTATVPAGASATASNTAGAATPTSGAVQRAAGGAAALVAVVLAVLVMV